MKLEKKCNLPTFSDATFIIFSLEKQNTSKAYFALELEIKVHIFNAQVERKYKYFLMFTLFVGFYQ
jgi:hypothetical protein